MFAHDHIPQTRKDCNTAKHRNRPIHRLAIHRRRNGEEAEDEKGGEEKEGDDVDGEAVFAK